MLVAGREKVHLHGMPDRINTCLTSEIGQSQFGIRAPPTESGQRRPARVPVAVAFFVRERTIHEAAD